MIKGDKNTKKSTKKANSLTYHAMIRDIDRQQFLEDEEDYNAFIKPNAKNSLNKKWLNTALNLYKAEFKSRFLTL